MNDFEEGYSFPEVESKLLIKEGKINKASYLLEGKFKLHFFSLASKQWEPVIEQFGFVLGPDKKHETKVSFFNLDVSQDKEIKLTLTEDFVNTPFLLNNLLAGVLDKGLCALRDQVWRSTEGLTYA